MAIDWNGNGNGFADFIRQFNPQTGQAVAFPRAGQAANSYAGQPSLTDAQMRANMATRQSPSGSNWWSAPPAPAASGGDYTKWAGMSAGPKTTTPVAPVAPPVVNQPGQANGSYFPNDPNNPLTTAARAQYDLNPTLAWQRVVGQTVTNPNSPQYAWARAQYQRYYQDYVQANGLNPNLTFTTYLDQRAPQLAQEFGNAPAAARGVTNTWLSSGRYTS